MPKDIRYLKGVGEKRAELFAKKGIKTVEDLLYYFPRSHEDRTEKKDIADCVEGETEYAYFNNDCIGRIGCFECGLVQ